jgi:hypothetical protein
MRTIQARPRTSHRTLSAALLIGTTSLLIAACGAKRPAGPKAAPPAPAVSTKEPTALMRSVNEWLVEDFEQAEGTSGGWWLEFDKSGLGTTVNPLPWKPTAGGAPPSPGLSARVFGTLGSNKAPWSWVQLKVFLNRAKSAHDLRSYQTLSFFVKGNGGRYAVALIKGAVKDHDHFRYEFTAPAPWTEIRVPISEFKQAGWGKRVDPVFEDVTQIQFSPAEFDQPFDVTVDHLVLSVAETKIEPVRYATADWFAWTGTDPMKRRGTVLDVSHLLDAPAGKHGPLGKKGEEFVFLDRTPVRFWGVNIVGSANFPTHEEADKLAELLAGLGVNMTRHHHIDASWSTPNVFGNKPSTLELDPVSMERFDYFIGQLQKRGIYQFFDMLVHRKATAEDGVTDADKLAAGFKIEGEFVPQLIALEERFIDQFMGHRNPYLKSTYARSPGVALVEIINEDSLFHLQRQGEFSLKSLGYHATLNRLFSDWLKRLVPGGRAALEKRWAVLSGRGGLLSGEDPALQNVDILIAFENYQETRQFDQRIQDTLRFLHDTQLGYYRRMMARLRRLGYRGLVAGSNHWTQHPLDLVANARLDFVDRHSYWSHPNGGWGYNADISWDPKPMVKDPNLGVVGSLARRRVKGLPYSASEWQTSAPNDYRQEGIPLLAAYASLQGWRPLEFALSHDFNNRPEQADTLANNFDILHQPTMLGAWPAASLLFHRRDVRTSDLDAFVKVDPEGTFPPDAGIENVPRLALIARTGIDFGHGQSAAELAAIRAKYVAGSVVTSSTGELRHDAVRGKFELDTARSQGFVGFRPDQPVKLGNVELVLKNPFSVLLVTAVDQAPIESAKRLLVTALGNAVNSGMTLSPSGNRLMSPGTKPILVEPIAGKVVLHKLSGPLDGIKAYALGPSGERQGEVTLVVAEGRVTLEMAATHRTLHYEIVRP